MGRDVGMPEYISLGDGLYKETHSGKTMTLKETIEYDRNYFIEKGRKTINKPASTAFTGEDYDKIQAICDENNTTISGFLREAALEKIEKMHKKEVKNGN